jgi:hypothetical protein
MKLPRNLYVGYNLLKKSRVVVKRNDDKEALGYFENILNEAQPKTSEDLILHQFVKGMYNENKHRFLSFIKNTSFECMVLWTESRSIVNFLGLRGVVYTKWVNAKASYSVTIFCPHQEGEENKEKKNVPVTAEEKYVEPVEPVEPVDEPDIPPGPLTLTRMMSMAVGGEQGGANWGDLADDE